MEGEDCWTDLGAGGGGTRAFLEPGGGGGPLLEAGDGGGKGSLPNTRDPEGGEGTLFCVKDSVDRGVMLCSDSIFSKQSSVFFISQSIGTIRDTSGPGNGGRLEDGDEWEDSEWQ